MDSDSDLFRDNYQKTENVLLKRGLNFKTF